MTVTPNHAIEIVSSFLEGGYHAECRCGWSSREFNSSPFAQAAATEHLASVCPHCGDPVEHKSNENWVVLCGKTECLLAELDSKRPASAAGADAPPQKPVSPSPGAYEDEQKKDLGDEQSSSCGGGQ